MPPRIRGVGLLAWLVSLAFLVDAASFTVDDADSSITYSPRWNIGNTCPGCEAQPPNHSLINDQTWHDATRNANTSAISFQYTFTGDSVTVYGILPDVIVALPLIFTANVDLTLNIDGETSGYTYTPVNSDSYQYQVPVFSKQGLSNTAHTMSVTLNPSSAFLFDYLVYTTPDTSTSSNPTPTAGLSSSGSSISIGSIVGIVAGVVGLLLIVIVILLFLLCRKRRQTRQNLGPQPLPAGMSDDHGVSEPFMQSTSQVALNNMSATTAFASSGNLTSSFNSPIGGATEATGVSSGAAITMNSKQRRMQEESGLLPTQQPQQRHHTPAWDSSEGSGAGTSYGGIDNVSSHTGPMSTSSANNDYHGSMGNTPLSRSTAPGVGGRIAPWNSGLYPHGIPAPVQLAAPVPVPLGLPLDSGGGSEARLMSAASGVTRPPTAPPPYIRSPPPLIATDESVGRGLELVSDHDEKR